MFSYRRQRDYDTGFYHVYMYLIFFSETTTKYPNKEQKNTTKFTDESLSTLILSPNTGVSPMARKTVENKHRTSLVIAGTGTFISTLLLVAIGYQLRSRIMFCRRETSHQQNVFFENGNVYAEADNVH